jgi:hypothetical protein
MEFFTNESRLRETVITRPQNDKMALMTRDVRYSRDRRGGTKQHVPNDAHHILCGDGRKSGH